MSLGIRAKLFASFGAILVLLAGVAGFAIVQLQAAEAVTHGFTSQRFPAIEATLQIPEAVRTIQRDLRDSILLQDDAGLAKWSASYATAGTKLSTQITTYAGLVNTDQGRVTAAALKTTNDAWLPIRTQVADLAKAKKFDEARVVLYGDAYATTRAALEKAATDADDLMQLRIKQEEVAASDAASLARTLMLGLTGAAILLGLGIAFFLARGVSSGVSEVQRVVTSLADNCATWLADALDAMARNDLTVDVQPVTAKIEHYGTDEIGQTAVASNKLRDKIVACIESYGRARAGLNELIGQVQSAGIGLAGTSAQLGSSAAQTGAAVQQVTMAVQNVASGAQETSRSAQETTHSVAQLSQVIDGIARGATDQARQVQTTSATASQMAAGIEQVAANATQMATAGQQTRAAAEHGGQAVRDTTAAMTEIQAVVGQAASKVRELGVLGQKIGAVVETIDDIAEQTNLLALNAAIEAARAGEHGKGFAVVADEVRKLAERSGRETKQIAELIAQVQTGTKEAVAAMDSGAAKVELGSEKADQAGQALEEILKAVQDTVRQVGEIASSSQQMASGARSVTDAMQSISAVVEESSAATEQMAAQASAVTGSIQSIAAVSEEQSAATEQVSASTEQMSAQVEQMSAQAQELASTAEQLKQLVARFKLDNAAAAAGSAKPSSLKSATSLRRAA